MALLMPWAAPVPRVELVDSQQVHVINADVSEHAWPPPVPRLVKAPKQVHVMDADVSSREVDEVSKREVDAMSILMSFRSNVGKEKFANEQNRWGRSKQSNNRNGRRNTKNFMPMQKEPIVQWLKQNMRRPYPSKMDIDLLCLQTGLTIPQIKRVLVNIRTRLKPGAFCLKYGATLPLDINPLYWPGRKPYTSRIAVHTSPPNQANPGSTVVNRLPSLVVNNLTNLSLLQPMIHANHLPPQQSEIHMSNTISTKYE